MEIIVLPIFALVVAICFSGMFAKHNRRRRRLARMSLDGAPPDELAAFEEWRKAARLNSRYADAAAYCAAFMWIFPFLLLGVLVLPFLANRQRRLAVSHHRALPDVPPGFKWLDAKEIKMGRTDETPAAPSRPRPWGKVAAFAGGIAVVAGGAVGIIQLATPEPKISGKPLSKWVEQVSDLDPNVRFMALQKLQYAPPEQLERHRRKLEKAAKYFPGTGQLLKDKFPEDQ